MADSNPYRPSKVQPGRRFRDSAKAMQVGELREAVERLTAENRSLKQRLDQLRKAAKSTTRIVKADTQFLPSIPGREEPPAEDTELLRKEIAQLQEKLEDCSDARRIERDNYRYALKEHTGTISKLEAELRRAQCSTAIVPQQPQAQAQAPSGREAEMMMMIKQLTMRLASSEQSAAACAHVARTAQAQQAEADESREKWRLKYREERKKVVQWETERDLNGGDSTPQRQRFVLGRQDGKFFVGSIGGPPQGGAAATRGAREDGEDGDDGGPRTGAQWHRLPQADEAIKKVFMAQAGREQRERARVPTPPSRGSARSPAARPDGMVAGVRGLRSLRGSPQSSGSPAGGE